MIRQQAASFHRTRWVTQGAMLIFTAIALMIPLTLLIALVCLHTEVDLVHSAREISGEEQRHPLEPVEAMLAEIHQAQVRAILVDTVEFLVHSGRAI